MTTPNETGQSSAQRYLALFGCNMMVFVASVCIMALELTAARLIAKNVGSSLYTWTSVIGIVLAGITCGNYIGGWLADRLNTRRLLAWLFFLASVTCFSVLWLDQLMLDWQRPAGMGWPLWIVLLVASMFLLPSTILGAISPAVASLALTIHLRTGITLGNVYAWGALGSIVGTFLTGFILIDVLGSRAIVTIISLILALMGVLVAAQQRVFRTAVLFGWMQFAALIGFVAAITGNQLVATAGVLLGPLPPEPDKEYIDDTWSDREILFYKLRSIGNAAHDLGLSLWLRDDALDEYHDESNYSTIVVGEEQWEESEQEEIVRFLRIDKLVHAYYNPALPDKLYYDYESVYAEATSRIVEQWRAAKQVVEYDGKAEVNSFFMGGGGYVFPRWVERRHAPSSVIEVAEIDPAVTRAVRQEFGLPEAGETRIVNIVGDARNVLDDRLRQNRAAAANGAATLLYDIAFGDAFNDFSVPWHLVTLEFTQKVKQALKPHGVYMVNLIDRYPRSVHKSADMPLPAQLIPEQIAPHWQAAPVPFAAIEIKMMKNQLWLSVRGAMSPALRDRLLALAPQQNSFTDAIKGLYTRSNQVPSGRFLARFVNTAKEVFGNVYVYSTSAELPHDDRDTFVIIASPHPIPALAQQRQEAYWYGTPFATLQTSNGTTHTNSRMDTLLAQAQGLLLTDDYAPVDNLLLPVVATQE